MEIQNTALQTRIKEMKAAIRENQDATGGAEEKANASTMASAKLVSLIGSPREVLIKENLFDEGLKVASDFQELDLPWFIMIMVCLPKEDGGILPGVQKSTRAISPRFREG